MIKKLSIFLIAITECFGYSIAQEIDSDYRKNNLFSIGWTSGINNVEATRINGEVEMQRPYGVKNELRFSYRYRFSNQVYAEAGIGLGVQSIRFKFPLINRFSLSEATRIPAVRYDFLGVYTFHSTDNYNFNFFGGFGFNRLKFLDESTSSHTSFGEPFETAQVYFKPNKNTFLPFVQFGIEFLMLNKRKNELSFRMSYQQGLKPALATGVYSHHALNTNSEGFLQTYLSGINLSVIYTFTRAEKTQRTMAYMKDNAVSKKQAAKNTRIERNRISPGSQYISVGYGFGGGKHKFIPNNEPFGSYALRKYMGRVSYEHNMKRNFLLEADYHFLWFGEAHRLIYSYWTSVFVGHFLNVGMGYHIQHPKTKFQFFNVHAGLGLGAHFNDRGPLGYGGGEISYQGSPFLLYDYQSEVRGNLIPIVYVGISKDIRITDKIALNLTYRYQQGLTNFYSTAYNYTLNNDSNNKTIKAKIDGTAFFVQFGLKYRIK